MAAVHKVKQSIKKAILENPTRKCGEVYDAEVDVVRDAMDEVTKQEFDSLMPSEVSMRPSIYGWKRQVIPPNPDSVEDINLDNPYSKMDDGESIIKGDENVNGDTKRRVIFMSTDKVLKEGVRKGQSGVMDATFKASPVMFSQLFIISLFISGVCWRPVGYAYMTDKYQDTYDTLFQILAGLYGEKEIQFKDGFKMLADWECAERNAWRNNFDEELGGCLFHFGQANWRAAQQHGLAVSYVHEPKVRVFMWYHFSLPHVPLADLYLALDVIRNSLHDFEVVANQSPEDNHLFENLRNYHSYFNRTWVNGSYSPSEWNYFEKDDITTSNAAESTNWRFTVKMGCKQPNIYNSLAAIKSDLKKTEKVFDLIELNRIRPYKNHDFVKKQESRRFYKQQYINGDITLERYMRIMGALNLKLDKKTKEKLRAREERVGDGLRNNNRRRTVNLVLDDLEAGGPILRGGRRGRARGTAVAVPRGLRQGVEAGHGGRRARGRGRGLNGQNAGRRRTCGTCHREYSAAYFGRHRCAQPVEDLPADVPEVVEPALDVVEAGLEVEEPVENSDSSMSSGDELPSEDEFDYNIVSNDEEDNDDVEDMVRDTIEVNINVLIMS